MKIRLAAGACALAAVGVVATGCGGDDKPTKAEYVSQVVKICKASDAKTKKLDREFSESLSGEPTVADIQAYAKKVTPVLKPDIEKARAVEAPDGDEAEVKAMNAALQKGAEAIYAAADDESAAQSLLDEDDPLADYNKKAVAYDSRLKACVD